MTVGSVFLRISAEEKSNSQNFFCGYPVVMINLGYDEVTKKFCALPEKHNLIFFLIRLILGIVCLLY